jgi:type II secretory pathway pseudopilin PulG
MINHKGFTAIEIIFVSVVMIIAGVFFFIQKQNIADIADDQHDKTAVNAIFYSLEEVYYPKNGYYPESINKDILPSVDPALFSDEYRYTPLNCLEGRCKSYELKASLIKEADYSKSSQRN